MERCGWLPSYPPTMPEKRKRCESLNLVIILPEKRGGGNVRHPEGQAVGMGVMCSSPPPVVQGPILESCKYKF